MKIILMILTIILKKIFARTGSYARRRRVSITYCSGTYIDDDEDNNNDNNGNYSCIITQYKGMEYIDI